MLPTGAGPPGVRCYFWQEWPGTSKANSLCKREVLPEALER